MRPHSRAALLAVTVAILLACDGQGPGTPADIVIAPNFPHVRLAGSQQLTATLVDADGREVGGEPVTFESSAPTVLAISETGLLSSVGPLGTSIIRASSGSLTAEVEADVVLGPFTLYVSPTVLSLVPDSAVVLSITVTDEHGDSIAAPELVFYTTNPKVANVFPPGHVIAGLRGTAIVTVVSGGLSREVLVAVSAP